MIETFLVFFALVTTRDGCCRYNGCPQFYVIGNFWRGGGGRILFGYKIFGQVGTSLQIDVTKKLTDTVMIFNETIIYLVSMTQ